MDRLESMRLFIKTVEHKSLSATARHMGMPLASLSRKLSELETHLGTKLLHRSTRSLSLTDVGQGYVVACRKILDDIDAAERLATGEYQAPKGDLVITAPMLFGRLFILPIVSEFLKAYPEINIRLCLTDRYVNLLDEHVDLALRIGELADSALMTLKLGESRQVICASPEYLNRYGVPTSPEALSQHQCITFEGVASTKVWNFTKGKTKISVPIHSRLSVTTAETAIEAALSGLGITRILSYQVVRLSPKLIQIILQDHEPKPVPIQWVFYGPMNMPQKLRAFLDFATPRLKAALG